MERAVVQPDVKRVMSTVVDHVASADMTNVQVERAMTAEVRNGMPGRMANSDVPDAVPGGMAATGVTASVTTVLGDRWETQQTDHGALVL